MDEQEFEKLRAQYSELKRADSDVRRVLEALKRSEREKEAILDCMSELVAYQDTDHRIRWVNRAAAASVGARPEELIGRFCYEVWQGRDSECEGCPAAATMSEGRASSGTMSSPDGRTWLVKTYPVLDENGETSSFVEVTEEITERVKAEREAREYREHIEHILSSSRSVIYTASTEEDYPATYISENVVEITGYEPADFTENPRFWIEQVHPSDRGLARNEVKKFLEKGRHAYEYRFRRSDGTYFWVRDDMRLLKDQEGEPAEIVGFWADVTDIKEAEVALRESEELYRTLVEASPDAIFMISLDGKVVWASNSACEMFRFESEKEIAGRGIVELVAPEDVQRLRKRLMLLPQVGSTRGVDYTYVRADGSRFVGEGSAALVRDAEGNPKFLVAALRNVTERKQIEERLRESRERYRSLMELLPVGVVIYLQDGGRIVYANQAVAQILGAGTPEELVGSPVLDFVHSDSLDVVRERMSRVSGRDVIPPLEEKLVRRDGEAFYAEVTGKSIDYQNQPAVMVIATDITERIEGRGAILAAAREWQQTFDAIEEAVCLIDPDGTIHRCNRAMRGLVGLKEGDLEGRKCYDVLHPGSGPPRDCPRLKSLQTGNREGMLLSNFDRLLEVYVDPVWNDRGSISGFVHTVSDITERRLTEEALKESEERFRGIAEAAQDAVVLVDGGGRIAFWNTAAERIFGYSAEEAVGGKINELLSLEEEKEYHLELIESFGETGNGPSVGRSLEFSARNRSGEVINVEVSSSAISREGEWLALVIARDISERKRMESAIQEHTERLRDIIDVTAHELRHPATVFKGYAKILLENWATLDEETIRDSLESVDKASDRLTHLAIEMLDTSRIERGELALDRDLVYPSELARRVATEMEARNPATEISIEAPESEREVSVDSGKVKDVLGILLENAIKFSPEGSEVEVCIEDTGSELVYSVADRGPGIPEKDRDAIFERFYQVADAQHHSVPGIGLGLHIARSIAEAHHGWLRAREREGGGSIFSFGIPVS